MIRSLAFWFLFVIAFLGAGLVALVGWLGVVLWRWLA